MHIRGSCPGETSPVILIETVGLTPGDGVLAPEKNAQALVDYGQAMLKLIRTLVMVLLPLMNIVQLPSITL